MVPIGRRRGIFLTILVSLAALGVAAHVSAPPALAAGETLSIQNDGRSVGVGQTFVVRVVQNTDVPISGASATVKFDKGILQITSVNFGELYQQAPILLPKDTTSAVARANRTGSLTELAAAFTPPGSVGSGSHDFLIISYKAVACGHSNLDLPVGPTDAQMLDGRTDSYGLSLNVATSHGGVDVCGTSFLGMTVAGGLPLWLVLVAAIAVLAVGVAFLILRRRSAGDSGLGTEPGGPERTQRPPRIRAGVDEERRDRTSRPNSPARERP